MSEKKDKPRGRPTRDSRGNNTWEWEVRTGVFGSDVDTARVKALVPDGLTVDSGEEPKNPEHDPYASGSPKPSPKQGKTRRTLDDMRRLSEEIKRQRAAATKKPKPDVEK